MEKEYPVKGLCNYDSGIKSYFKYFDICDNVRSEKTVLMESTPDYMYSEGALNILEYLPNAKIVFVLRDPIERLVSWYKYSKQKYLINDDMSFREYVECQIDCDIDENTPIHLRALLQGKYSGYIRKFEKRFGDKVIVLLFDDLKKNPKLFLGVICEFAGLNSKVYDDYEFKAVNVSKRYKYAFIAKCYRTLRRFLVKIFVDNSFLFAFFQRLNLYFKKMLRYNEVRALDVYVGDETMNYLKKYYSYELEFIKKIQN